MLSKSSSLRSQQTTTIEVIPSITASANTLATQHQHCTQEPHWQILLGFSMKFRWEASMFLSHRTRSSNVGYQGLKTAKSSLSIYYLFSSHTVKHRYIHLYCILLKGILGCKAVFLLMKCVVFENILRNLCKSSSSDVMVIYYFKPLYQYNKPTWDCRCFTCTVLVYCFWMFPFWSFSWSGPWFKCSINKNIHLKSNQEVWVFFILKMSVELLLLQYHTIYLYWSQATK